MNLQLFIPALALGAVSSFHCVGMCGAFALSIPVQHLSNGKKILAIFLYNTGRITTYTILGLLFGLLGRQIEVAGFQQWFSILAGILILMIPVQNFFRKPVLHLPGYSRVSGFIAKLITRFVGKPSLPEIYLLGQANGLLPCGLVYVAITGASATGSIAHAGWFMAAYGVGTVPAMFLLSYFRLMIGLSVRNKIKRATPVAISLMAGLLILRGLNLNIPYISPVFSTSQNIIPCH